MVADGWKTGMYNFVSFSSEILYEIVIDIRELERSLDKEESWWRHSEAYEQVLQKVARAEEDKQEVYMERNLTKEKKTPLGLP